MVFMTLPWMSPLLFHFAVSFCCPRGYCASCCRMYRQTEGLVRSSCHLIMTDRITDPVLPRSEGTYSSNDSPQNSKKNPSTPRLVHSFSKQYRRCAPPQRPNTSQPSSPIPPHAASTAPHPPPAVSQTHPAPRAVPAQRSACSPSECTHSPRCRRRRPNQHRRRAARPRAPVCSDTTPRSSVLVLTMTVLCEMVLVVVVVVGASRACRVVGYRRRQSHRRGRSCG